MWVDAAIRSGINSGWFLRLQLRGDANSRRRPHFKPDIWHDQDGRCKTVVRIAAPVCGPAGKRNEEKQKKSSHVSATISLVVPSPKITFRSPSAVSTKIFAYPTVAEGAVMPSGIPSP